MLRGLFDKGTNLLPEGSTLLTESPPKDSSLEVRIPAHELGGDTDIQTAEVIWCVQIPIFCHPLPFPFKRCEKESLG